LAFLAVCLRAQTPEGQAQGIEPRAGPSDYQAQAKTGSITIAAEFAGHAIPTLQGPLSTENHVVVEIGMYGPPEMRLQLSFTDFTLRINGAKKTIEAQHSETVAQSVKDPNWVPPEKQDKSKSFNVGGGGESTESKGPVKVPLEVQRGMAQRVRKASLAEGNRLLPQAGLLYFRYAGKVKAIHSIELIYSGPAGNTTLALAP